MEKLQNGLIAITTGSLVILLGLFILKDKKSSKYLKWYIQMSKEERSKYNPILGIKVIRKVLILSVIVGIIFLIGSHYINEKFSIIGFIIILILYIYGMLHSGANYCLIDKKDYIENFYE